MFEKLKIQSRLSYKAPKNDDGSLLVRFSGASKYGNSNQINNNSS